jgi:chromosome segregation ATPase
VSKSYKSKDNIGKSIDGILGGLTIRGRHEKKEDEVEVLKKRLNEYEKIGALEVLRKQKEELLQSISKLQTEEKELQGKLELALNELKDTEQRNRVLAEKVRELYSSKAMALKELTQLKKEKEPLMYTENSIEQGSKQQTPASVSLAEKNNQAYRPSRIIKQYCEGSEGKRKLTIHLRELEYHAILKVSHSLPSTKGQMMEIITRALRSYIPKAYYEEAEKEVYQKAIHSVRGILEDMGYSLETIDEKMTQWET